MTWYMAKMIFRIVAGEGHHKAQFDEQLRLIAAPDAAEAFSRAQCLGKSNEISFMNDRSEAVRWEFIDIAELYKLPALQDGAELHSRFSEKENAGMFIDITHHKADQIRKSVEQMTIETI